MPLQISIRWKWLKGTLRVSNDASLRAHIDEELRNNGQWGEYNISRLSDGNCNGYVRERSPPGLNEGNMPQYDIKCTRSILEYPSEMMTREIQPLETTPSRNHDYIKGYESGWMTQERLLGVSGQNEIKHRSGVYLITVDNHVNQWGSINLDQNGEYAPV